MPHKGVSALEFTLLVCRPVRRNEFEKQEFTGEDDILALVETGSFCFDNGNGMQTVGPLEAVNFKQGISYRRRILEPATMYFFRYRADTDIFGSGKVSFRDTGRIASTLSLLHLSDDTVRPDEFACKQTLFADLVNQYQLENAALENAVTDPVVRSAMSHIDNSLHFKLDLSKLAKEQYLSYVQFSRRFKNATGSTPQEYITALRLKRAQKLLTESDLTVKQVAQTCGFANEYYFSNFFHKHCQMPPGQYRNMIRSTDDT